MIDNPKRKPRFRQRSTLSQEIKKGYWYLIFALIGLNIILGGLLLAVGGYTNAKGYTLTELQRQSEKLMYENRVLDKQITEAQAFTNLEEKTEDMTPALEDEANVTYTKDNSTMSAHN